MQEALLPVTAEGIAFAEERLKMHESNSPEGYSLDELKKHFAYFIADQQ
ncbi:MAG TPA: hypothetical protein PLA68_01200 [Panacibacter sp.]|nr:hypothetical protein [Panacibacter sp.]